MSPLPFKNPKISTPNDLWNGKTIGTPSTAIDCLRSNEQSRVKLIKNLKRK